MLPPSLVPARLAALLLATTVLCAAPVHAERADRNKPMSIEADQPGSVDLQRQIVIFNGNVVITQGTMLLRADKVELRERPDGYREAKAIGTAERPASFRQKRDGVDETVEGVAERIEFDAKTDTLRFVGNAAVRRLRAGVLADEITGSLITWDNTNELFKVTGGAVTPNNPTGRVRAVLAPREESAASAASAASAPKVTLPLKPSGTLGAPR
ncbi:MAG: lipopolysaccharide transport periplasmic protein LptA [Rubrivivax sp.]|nr:lipopolysaccharide transport periplasmic protein LptA [Rubrivivax sp.]